MSTLTSLLVRDRVVPVRRIEEAIERQVVSGLSLPTVLAELQVAPENVLAAYVAASLDMPPLPRQALEAPPRELLDRLPPERAAAWRAVPVARLEDGVAVAMDHNPPPEDLAALAEALGEPVVAFFVLEPRLEEALHRCYGVEISRKMARIAKRLDARPSGEIPEVAPPEATRLDLRRRRRLSLPGRSPRTDPNERLLGTSGTQRFGTLPDGEPPPTPAEEHGAETRRERDPTPSPNPSLPTPRPPATRPEPLHVVEALEHLERAREREQVVDVLWQVAASCLRRMALFTVRGPHGVLHRAWPGGDLPVGATIPLRGALHTARASGAPVLLERAGPEDAALLSSFGERIEAPLLVVPVTLQGRAVLLLGGDREGERFGLPDVAELLAVVPAVAEAFGRIIRARKLQAFQPPASLQRSGALGPRRPQLPARDTARRANPWRPPHRLVTARRATVLGMPPVRTERASSHPPPSQSEHEPPPSDPPPQRERDAPRPASFDRLGVPRTPPPPPLPREVEPGVGFYATRPARSDSLPPPRRASRPPSRAPSPSHEADAGARPGLRPSAPTRSPTPGQATPRNLRDEGRRVIVQMDARIPALVQELLHSAPDEQHPALDRLLALGEAALPALIEAFPGPLWFDRRHPHRRSPRGEDVSPIARALVAFGRRSVPYLPSLLAAPSPDRRYYALLVARQLADRRLVQPVGRCLFDEDAGVRAMAAEVLRSLQRYHEEMESLLDSLRHSASDRRRDTEERTHALRALGALRDPHALHVALEALESRDERVAQAAHDALVTLTRQDFGRSHRRWKAWVERNRSRHRIEWLIDALTHSDERLRTAAGRELGETTHQFFGFHPGLPKRDREVCQRKYRIWWDREGRQRFLARTP